MVYLAVYLRLVINYNFSYFSLKKSLNMESLNQAKNLSRWPPKFPNQNLRQIGHGVPTSKQTNKQITTKISKFFSCLKSLNLKL